MKYYIFQNTEKFPFRYFIETPHAVLNTTNKRLYVRTLRKIKGMADPVLTLQHAKKLELCGFSVIFKPA